MNRDFIQKWCAELRDPANKQGRVHLCKSDGSRCCLGVAADLAGVPKKLGVNASKLLTRDSTKRQLYYLYVFSPTWRNANSAPPNGWLGLTAEQLDNLIAMNDSGRTFPEIAAWIEANIKAEDA